VESEVAESELERICHPCPGGDTACPGEVFLGRGAGRCADGHKGPVCALCKQDDINDMWYKTPGKFCLPCPEPGDFLMMGLIIFALVVIATVSFYYFCKRIGFAALKVLPLGTAKIFTSYLMVISSVSGAYKVKVPLNFKGFLESLSFLSLDVSSSANCVALVEFTFYQRFMGIVCSWMVVIAVFQSIYLCGLFFKPKGRPRVEWRALVMKGNLFALTVMHPSVSSTLFLIMSCEDVYGSGLWLREDYNKQCRTDEWWVYTLVGAFVACLFTFGLPFGLLMILRHQFHKMMDAKGKVQAIPERDYDERVMNIQPSAEDLMVRKREDYEVIIHYLKLMEKWEMLGFMHEDYLSQYYYAEIIETLRKVFLTSFAITIGQLAEGFDIIFGILCIGVFFGIHMFLWPYRDNLNNWLRMGELVTEYVTLFCLMLLSLSKDASSYNANMMGWILLCIQWFLILGSIIVLAVVAKSSWAELLEAIAIMRRRAVINRRKAKGEAIGVEDADVVSDVTADFTRLMMFRAHIRAWVKRHRARKTASVEMAQKLAIEKQSAQSVSEAMKAHRAFLATGHWPSEEMAVAASRQAHVTVLSMPDDAYRVGQEPKVLAPPIADPQMVFLDSDEPLPVDTTAAMRTMGMPQTPGEDAAPALLNPPRAIRTSVINTQEGNAWVPSTLSYLVTNQATPSSRPPQNFEAFSWRPMEAGEQEEEEPSIFSSIKTGFSRLLPGRNAAPASPSNVAVADVGFNPDEQRPPSAPGQVLDSQERDNV